MSSIRTKRPSLWEFGGIGPIRLGKRVWKEFDHDDIYGKAAELSYYFLLALFPALLFIVNLLGFWAGPGSELRDRLFATLQPIVPPDSFSLIADTVRDVSESAGGGKLTFGLVTALWTASGGLSALISTLNVAYEVKESRSWIKSKLVALGLTLELSILIILSLAMVLFGGKFGSMLAGYIGWQGFGTVWQILQWGVVLGGMLLAFASVYYYAPNLKDPEWYWISPGAVLGLVLWLLVSYGFRLYLEHFNSFSKTYGSLGAVIILMVWFYLSGLAVLIGGEVNSEIGHVMDEAKAREEQQPSLAA